MTAKTKKKQPLEPLPDSPLAILEKTYNSLFEVALNRISNGEALSLIIRSDNRDIDYSHFLRWIHKDEERKRRYREAQELATEVHASEIISIADCENDSLEDVARSKLRIDARKFLMSSWNRSRYGDVKQVDQTVKIDITGAMQEAEKRLTQGIMIEGSYETSNAE